MAIEQEFHAHRGKPAKRAGDKFCTPDDDTAPHFSQYDDQAGVWTLDVYQERHAKHLVTMGCKALPSTHGAGKLFAVDTRQLIQFLADSEDIPVEFRSRRKAQLSPEQLEAKRARMRALNAAKLGDSLTMNGA
jgi:hypothetical protein